MGNNSRTDPLTERLAFDCRLTGGTMPLRVVVADEAEKAQTRAWLTGKRHGKLITVITCAEDAAIRVGVARLREEQR